MIDAVKAVKALEQLEIPVLDIIENMSGMVCPCCGEVADLFGRGGGEVASQEFTVPYPGAISPDLEMVKAGDEGARFF